MGDKITGKTDSGFEFEIDPAALDDWDFIDVLSELDAQPQNIVKAAKILLGKDQVDKLRQHNMRDGRPSLTGMTADLESILKGIKTGKN